MKRGLTVAIWRAPIGDWALTCIVEVNSTAQIIFIDLLMLAHHTVPEQTVFNQNIKTHH
jgi:hypothetical protein